MRDVAFVCSHGAAKSVVAAAYYRALTSELGREARAVSFGVEPDPEIPETVVDGLRRDGLEITPRPPVAPTAEALAGADLVVLIGCELPEGTCAAPIVRWEDVPAVSDGYDTARTEIVRRLRDLLSS